MEPGPLPMSDEVDRRSEGFLDIPGNINKLAELRQLAARNCSPEIDQAILNVRRLF